MSTNSRNPQLRFAVGLALAAAQVGLLATVAGAAPPTRPGSPVFIGQDGKLGGPMTGWAWVAASPGTSVAAPAPCNAQGCFKNTGGQLCARGTIPALKCTGQGSGLSCDWQTNWGVVIGMNATDSGGPWQSGAPSSVSLAYQGSRAKYRLNAHMAGDPDSKIYCVDAYRSGQVAEAQMFKSRCWSDSGEPLSDFQKVDKITLEIMPAMSPVPFDTCITAVAVNGSAAPASDGIDHVLIEDDGKLGGTLSGYAWIAGGAGTVFTSPQPCNQNGCFRNTQGRLCARGNIAPLLCKGQGAQLSCNWQANWGGMIGMNVNASRKAWGAAAPGSLAVTFTGAPATYRLMAHVAGEPDTKVYCVDHYRSGQTVEAQMMKSACWSDSGDVLAGFQNVDRIGLHVVSGGAAVPIDVCISDIAAR